MANNDKIVNASDLSSRIKPVLDILSGRFIASYNPGQELSVDEAMEYKGRKGGKVRMPNKARI